MCQAINQELIIKMEESLKQSFPDGDFEINDGDDGSHLHVTVTAGLFRDKSMIQQHRMVYAALDELLKSGELHSINIKTVAA